MGDLVHALTHSNDGSEMKNGVDVLERTRHRLGITNVAADKFDVA